MTDWRFPKGTRLHEGQGWSEPSTIVREAQWVTLLSALLWIAAILWLGGFL